MEVFDAVRTVLAVRSYQDKPVPPEVVRRIVEAGRLSASGSNKQPWHFIVVDDRHMLQQLGKVVTTGPYVAQAAFAIVVALDKSPLAVSDGSRAIQSMMLTAWDAGVGSNWTGFMGPNEVKPLLGIPNELDILAIIPFGSPDKKVGQGKKNRKALSEIASHGRFGQPFK